MASLLYAFSVQTFVDMLTDLLGVLDKGIAHIEEKKLDPESFLTARLAPDMFTLIQQIQVATFQAQASVAYLAGREPPPFDGNEKTFDDLKAQIRKTIDYVKSVPESALVGGETRRIHWPLPGDIAFEATGLELLKDWALPHFYFHVTTAYDILRHKGVELGKFDYLAHMRPMIRQTAK
jgi:hypothetical protein